MKCTSITLERTFNFHIKKLLIVVYLYTCLDVDMCKPYNIQSRYVEVSLFGSRQRLHMLKNSQDSPEQCENGNLRGKSRFCILYGLFSRLKTAGLV